MEAKKLLKILALCQKNWPGLLLTVIFFVLYLGGMKFYVDNGQFNSPDESANYYFLQNLTQTGQIPVAQSEGMTDIVHPRSILVWQNKLVPISFPGLIYVLAPFYWLGGLWGVFVFYGLLFVFFLYLLWRWIRRENLPKYLWWIAALQPALWYYLFHPLFNSVLSFILGFSALLLLTEKSRFAKYGGIFVLSVALWVRPFDLIYLGPILLLGAIYYQVKWRRSLSYLAFIGGGALLFFGLSNYAVYGHPCLFGYTLPKPTNVGGEQVLDYWRSIKLFLKNIWYFIGQLFWPYFAGAALGVGAYLWAWRRSEKIYHFLMACLLFGGGALILFYGFGDLNDHVVKNNISIGGAFARYWLPIYFLMTVPLVYFFEKLKVSACRCRVLLLVSVLVIFSVYAVWSRDNDSLMQERQNLSAGIVEKNLLQKIVPPNVVLVLDREDKYFFPERTVIHLSEFQDDYALSGIRDLLSAGQSVYYYGFTLGGVDWNYLHEKKLAPLSLRLNKLLAGEEKSLYQFQLYE